MTVVISCDLKAVSDSFGYSRVRHAHMDMYIGDFFQMFINKFNLTESNCKTLDDIPNWDNLPAWARADWLTLIFSLHNESEFDEFRGFFSTVETEFGVPDDENDDYDNAETESVESMDETDRMNDALHLYSYYFSPKELLEFMDPDEYSNLAELAHGHYFTIETFEDVVSDQY